jgi:Mg2+ and Co2+ transporter CorA
MNSRATPPERDRDYNTEMPVPQTRSSEDARLNVLSGQAGPSIHLNLGRENLDVLDERQIMPGLEYFVKYAAWNASEDRLQTWSCTPNLQDSIGEGSGQLSAAFSIGSQRFCSLCAEIGFSQSFLQKVVAKAPMLEYGFDFPELANESTPPSHLELAMSTFENDSFFCLLRYGLKKNKSKVLLFLKARDYLRRNRPLLPQHLIAWFDSHRTTLHRYPLMILNSLLDFIQHEAHQYVRWRLELYSLESRLGVTRDGDALTLGGYAEVDHDFALLNADLAGLAKKLADTELSASTILEHAKALQRIVGYCEEYEALNARAQSSSAKRIFSENKEEIQATIIRAELYLRHVKMAQISLQSLSAVLYNRINKQDTDSMKTIAVVTLVFLPATFVSAIFSTGIFNFHASESPDNPRTISKYGWVYLLVCLLSTSFTLVSWVCWYRWGRVWLEKLKFSRIHSDGKKNPIGCAEAHHDSKSSPPQTLVEKRKRAEKETDPEGHNTSVGLEVHPPATEHRPSFHGILETQYPYYMNSQDFHGAHIVPGNARIYQKPSEFYGIMPQNF